MPVTRSKFLDCPPRYTRIQRTGDSDARQAYAMEHKPTGYGPTWWGCLVVLCIAAAVVIVIGS